MWATTSTNFLVLNEDQARHAEMISFQLFSPYFYWDDAKPRYAFAMSANSLFALVAICCVLFLRWDLIRANCEFDMKGKMVDQEVGPRRPRDGLDVHQAENSVVSTSFRYVT